MSKNPFVDAFGDVSPELLQNIAEILVLRLPEGSDRVIASKWVKKFKKCNPKDFKSYLSLFVASLTKQMLVEPFNVAPDDPTSDQWQHFDKEYVLEDINNAVIRDIYKDSLTPPYKIEVSRNLREYVCYQEIPFFGAHFYYAFSPREKIETWSKFNKLNVPKSQVEILRREEQESPVTLRGTSKAVRRETGATQRTARGGVRPKTPRAKPQWEGPIPDESEPEPLTPKPMITISTNSTPKAIPPALQRRMAAAAERTKQAKEKRAQDRSTASTSRGGPSTSRGGPSTSRGGPSTSRGSARKTPSGLSLSTKKTKKPRGQPLDDIDAALTSTSAAPQPSPPPVFTGPHAEIQKRLHELRKANPPTDLLETTRDMRDVTEAMAEEAERLNEEGTANITTARRIERREMNIGSNIVRMMRTNQVTEVQNAAEEAVETIENVQMTMEQLNEYLGTSRQPTNDIVSRLEAVKQSMRDSATAASDLSLREEAAASSGLLVQLDVIADAHTSMANALHNNVQPANKRDALLIQGLEDIHLSLANHARDAARNLEESIQSGGADVTNVMYQTARTVDDIFDSSFDNDEQYVTCIEELSETTKKAAQLYKHHHEIKMQKDVEKHLTFAMSTPEVRKYMPMEEDEHLTEIPDDFGVESEDVSSILHKFKTPVRKRTQTVLFQTNTEEDLFNISATLVDDLNESIDEIENVIIPFLENAKENASTKEEQNILRESIETTQENSETLYDCLSIVGSINTTLEMEEAD